MAHRKKPAYRDPKLLAQDIFNIADHLHAPVMIIGDPFQAGEDYGLTFLSEMKKRPIQNHVAFEFFVPPSRILLEKIAEAIPNFNIEISPESHDEEVRRAFGRPYDNSSLEKMISDAIVLGCKRIDLFFMTGSPSRPLHRFSIRSITAGPSSNGSSPTPSSCRSSPPGAFPGSRKQRL